MKLGYHPKRKRIIIGMSQFKVRLLACLKSVKKTCIKIRYVNPLILLLIALLIILVIITASKTGYYFPLFLLIGFLIGCSVG